MAIEKCESCGNYHEVLYYSPRCHPGAPMFLALFTEDQTLTATCAQCGKPAGLWKIKEDDHELTVN